MRHLTGLLLALIVGCGDPKDESLDMEVTFPCSDDCAPNTVYTGNVEVILPAKGEGDEITCKVKTTSTDIEIGPPSGLVAEGEATLLDKHSISESTPMVDSDFLYRCKGDGGPINIECSSGFGMLPLVSQAIACPTAPEPSGPTCGVVIVVARGDFTTSNFRTQVAVAPANSADATAADALAAAAAADAIPLGACSDTPTNPTFTAATDLGQSIELKDGATVLQTVSKGSGNFYSGFGGMGTPPYDKPLTVGHGGAGVMPTPLDAGLFPGALVVTSPAEGSPAMITAGQPFTLTWTPVPGLTSLVVSFGTDMKTCRFDPAAGTGTVPGTITSGLTSGGGMTILGARAGKTAATVGGTACVVKTVSATGSGRTLQVQ